MLTITKVGTGHYYLEYNGRFVESFDTKRDAIACKELLVRKNLLPA